MKILTLDLETSPNLAHVWDIWSKGPVSPQQVIQQWDVMMGAAHWLGSPEPAVCPTEFHNGYMPMLSTLWQLMDEADAMLTYNGKKFDRPRLNTVFALNGFTPPSPTTDIDLYETIRRVFQFPSSSLDYVSRQFGLGGKVKNSGYDLWRRCLLREPEAWEEMRVYCIGDVMLTEQLYFKVLPWISRHPSQAAVDGELRCINCHQIDTLIKQGIARTLVRTYQRYRCAACGKWQRGAKSVPGVSAPVMEMHS